MKKNFKRWLAFLLAVVLVATTCMFSSDSFLRASEDENGAEDAVEETIETQELIVPQPEEPEEAPAPVVEEPAEETQPETQEQTPEQPQEPVGDVPAEDGTEVTPEAPAAEEAVAPTQTPEEEKPEETPAPVVTSAPEATTAPTASATPEASASPTPTATPDGEEEAVNYAYEIRYYYEGVEDEESRVVKGDGVLDELILDADTLKENVTRDGKAYVLDKIENGNGRITKREEDNVVSVYYILAGEEEPEEEDVTYSLRVKTVLSDGGKVEVVSPKEKDKAGKNTYRENTEVTFEVSVNEGYELSSVQNQDGEELETDSREKGISAYTVTMTRDMVVTVTFREKEKEAKMPAQTLTASAGDISITISAPEGVLPEGTTVKAVPVSRSAVEDAVNEKLAEEGMKAVDIVAVDITLYDKDGNEIQPDGELEVTFGNVSASESAETAAVFHVDTDNNVAEKVAEVSTGASAAGFQTDHFSIWTYVTGESTDTLASDDESGVTADVTIQIGKSETLIGTGSSGNNYPSNYKDGWTSDDMNVVSVQGSGKTATVTGESEGTAVVTHTYYTRTGNWLDYYYTKHSDTWIVKVVPAVTATEISLDRESLNLMVGKSEQITATVVPEEANVTWRSSNTNVATVDKTGKVTAQGIGEAIITAESGEVSASINVTVSRNTDNDQEQTAYFYVWKPGTAEGTDYTVAWYYMGTGTVKGPKATASGIKYYDTDNMVKSYPGSFQSIVVDEQTYTYDPTGTGDYTYKIQWSVITDANGANNGSAVITNSACYHVDGYAVLKTPNMITVDFQIKNPGSDGFASVEISEGDKWPKIFKEGSNVTAPTVDAAKTVNGVTYRFDGWYKDSACTSKAADSDFADVRDSIIFYGKYVADFELIYDGNGANIGTVPASVKRQAGTEVTVSGNTGALRKTGYEFNGWNTEADGTGTAYSAGSKITLDDNVTLYAQWKPGEANYTVQYWQQNANDNNYTLHESASITGTTGEHVTAEIKEYTGFEHVTIADSAESGTIAADGSLVLKMYYNRITYSVEYDLDGGTSTTEKLKYTGLKYGVDTPEIDEPAKMGYLFNGWMPDIAETVRKDTIYKAQWQQVTLKAIGYEKPYDGASHGPESVTLSGAEVSATIEYQVNGKWTTVEPEITNVGTETYSVRAIVKDNVVAETTVSMKAL